MNGHDRDFKMSRPSGASLIFSADTVVKHFADRQQLCLELEKTRVGAQVGRASGRFDVPRVLGYDLAELSITFQRLHGFHSVRETLFASENTDDILIRVGQALAALHNQDPLPTRSSSCFPDLGVERTPPHVLVHGDFCVTNLLYNADSDTLVFIDWSPPPWSSSGGIHGPCYLDPSTLVGSLFIRRPFEPLSIRHPQRRAQVFLESYRAQLRHPFVIEEFRAYFAAHLSAFVDADRRLRAKLRLAACRPSLASARSFVRTLKLGPA